MPESRSSILYSSIAHVLVLGALLVASAHSPRLATNRMPGTQHGLQMLTYYSPGGAPAQVTTSLQKLQCHSAQPSPSRAHAASQIAAPAVSSPATDLGTGSSGPLGLGQGNLNIALQKFFPSPHPDLSTLAPGTQGDVVVDATIDAQGNIIELTLVRGISDPINDAVLATVRNWTYTPATRDGTPTPSEQELLFHFSRG